MARSLCTNTGLPSLRRYRRHLRATAAWLDRSIIHGHGGSCAYFSPFRGWSRPYPETTGYLIPTLLQLDSDLPDRGTHRQARLLGNWLLKIQHPDGYWLGGFHPPSRGAKPSVFNTAQVVTGLLALYSDSNESPFIESALRAGRWLCSGLRPDGLWVHTDYRATETPTYYTHAAWPLLELWSCTREPIYRDAGSAVMERLVRRQRTNGAFHRWGFTDTGPAFTHTIGYTLYGFVQAARLLDDWERFGGPAVDALSVLMRQAELRGGRLPGALTDDWEPAGHYVCLTGNAQIALCLLAWEHVACDLRIVNAAAKLIDYVCSRQTLRAPLDGVRGAVPGSFPPWGRYMLGRYPNWAAKFHCDALSRLDRRITAELP
jgi:hypothetical protein